MLRCFRGGGGRAALRGNAQKVSADSGFFSVKNLEALTASGIDAYVPDSNMAHALESGWTRAASYPTS